MSIICALVCPLFLLSFVAQVSAKDWCSFSGATYPVSADAHGPTVVASFSYEFDDPWGSVHDEEDPRLEGVSRVFCTLSSTVDRPPIVAKMPVGHDEASSSQMDYPGLRASQNDPAIQPPIEGFSHPMDNMRTIRGFDGAKCRHQGLDIFGDDEYFGTGKPIYAITRAEVSFIGTPEKSGRAYGRRDRRHGTVKRGKAHIPRQMHIDSYGTIYPFTRNLGRARTGVFVVTKSKHEDYPEHLVRYMHLAAVHPDLKVGDIVEAGQEIGLMGSTAVMKSLPHLHLDMETPKGLRVNPAPMIGLAGVLPSKCRALTRAQLIRMKRRHVVRRGDSLWKIARKYKTTVRQLKRLNRLRRGIIRPGQKLRIR